LRSNESMKRTTKIVSVLWIVNFAFYIGVASWLGGDAVNGHSEAGHYFLAMHGRLTEVSHDVFNFSLWYTYFLFTHFAVALVLSTIQWRSDKGVGPVT